MSHALDDASPSTSSKRRVLDLESGTPTNRRFSEPQSSNSYKQSADDIEDRILIEGRGQIRTDVTCDEFQKSFFSHLNQNVETHRSHTGYFDIPESQKWGEKEFYREVLKSSMEQMCLDLNPDLKFCYTSNQCPHGSKDGKPDFLIVRTPEVQPTEGVSTEGVSWKDVEFVMGHSQEISKKPAKFLQWLRDARTMFQQQPYRRCCFGVIFLKPYAFLCYADHGCAAFSVPLEMTQQSDGRKFLVGFLTSFLTSADWERGRDPDIKEQDDTTILIQGGQHYLIGKDIFHSTALVGRNIRVFTVKEQGSERAGVCKFVWEEISSDLPSGGVTHRSECEVIKHLQDAGVRGLPEVWGIEHAKVNGAYTETASVPTGKPFKENISEELLRKKTSTYVTGGSGSADRISKSKAGKGKSSRNSKGSQIEELITQSPNEGFHIRTNKPRQLYRLIMSECQGLEEKIDQDGFEELMPVVRDAMICYYECYKIPSPGQLQADISDKNIMATTPNTTLTAQLSEIRPRKGTIIDWNLSYPASGLPTSRHIRSGTPAFMALELLRTRKGKDDVQQRTLRHDLESFFTVILYMAMTYKNPGWRSSYFAGAFDPKKPWVDIYSLKKGVFSTDANFEDDYLTELRPDLPGGWDFQELLQDIRRSLYHEDEKRRTSSDNKDYIKNCEALFLRIMGLIDQYLNDDFGCMSLNQIHDRKGQD